MNMNPGGRSTRTAPLLPSTVPFTAEKVSTTTAGREFWEGARSVSRRWAEGRAGEGCWPSASTACLSLPHGNCSWTEPGTGRRAADRQREEGRARSPCLTEAASPAAVSPGSWAPAEDWVPPATSEASAGCNINAAGSDAGPPRDRQGPGQHRVVPTVGQCPCTAQGAPGEGRGPGHREQLVPDLALTGPPLGPSSGPA